MPQGGEKMVLDKVTCLLIDELFRLKQLDETEEVKRKIEALDREMICWALLKDSLVI